MPTDPFVPDGVWVPRAILAIASRFAVPLYLELRRHCYETPECFPGHRRLARLVGCSIGTVSTLTDQFNALGVIRKTHTGRHCHYRFAEGCWRRRKPRHASKSAHRSVGRTEDKNNCVVPVYREPEPKKLSISQRFVLPVERRAKRVSLIRSLRRWTMLSPCLPDAERPHRLAMLDRAEAQLDDWSRRTPDDKRCFEMLATRARAMPLAGAVTDSLRQRAVGMPAIGAFLPTIASVRWA